MANPKNGSELRVDIQALRAIAVMLVVIFHLWPDLIPGGYVGVDVFFVISGFLITGHLLRELSSTGKINFPSFYARRIKRLLPMAVTVIVAVAIGTYLFLPWRLWQNTSEQLVSSLWGYQNWYLAAQSVDYFGSSNVPSPVQHFWSLSLEEQFYLFWPMLLFIGFVALKKLKRPRYFFGLFVVVVSLSFIYSVYETSKEPTIAYFSTFTHIWEFALGGLVALNFETRSERPLSKSNLGKIFVLVGIGAILFSAFVFNGESPFPGYIALLPTAGVLLVLVAKNGRDSLDWIPRAFKNPVVWTGNNSYGIYLWHWPLIVMVPAVIDHALGNNTKFGILLLTFILAAVSTYFVERPIRFSKNRYSRNMFVFPAALAVVVATSGLSFGLTETYKIQESQSNQLVSEALNKEEISNSCLGAAAMYDLGNCTMPFEVRAGFGPDFAAQDWGTLPEIQKDRLMIQPGYCTNVSKVSEPVYECSLGDVSSSKKVAVVGDSHAFALLEPLVTIAKQNGYEVRAYLHDSCSPRMPLQLNSQSSPCDQWRLELAKYLEGDQNNSAVIFTGFSRSTLGTEDEEIVEEYSQLYSKIQSSGKDVFVISDVPLTGGINIPECVANSNNEYDPCSKSRTEALGWDPSQIAVSDLNNPKIKLVDLTNNFCGQEKCHAVIGGLIAYRDDHHASGRFAQSMLKYLDEQLVLN